MARVLAGRDQAMTQKDTSGPGLIGLIVVLILVAIIFSRARHG